MVRPCIDEKKLLKLLTPMPNINHCICGNWDIAINENSNYTILKCNKCNREIKRRTYEKAEKAWNKNNPNRV